MSEVNLYIVITSSDYCACHREKERERETAINRQIIHTKYRLRAVMDCKLYKWMCPWMLKRSIWCPICSARITGLSRNNGDVFKKNSNPQVKKDLEMCNACFGGKHWIVELRNIRSTHPKWLVKEIKFQSSQRQRMIYEWSMSIFSKVYCIYPFHSAGGTSSLGKISVSSPCIHHQINEAGQASGKLGKLVFGACVATPTGQVFKWHFPQWYPGSTVPALWRGAMIQLMGSYSNSSISSCFVWMNFTRFYQSLNWQVGPFW